MVKVYQSRTVTNSHEQVPSGGVSREGAKEGFHAKARSSKGAKMQIQVLL